jgi:hypothetical protein
VALPAGRHSEAGGQTVHADLLYRAIFRHPQLLLTTKKEEVMSQFPGGF